MNNQEKYIREFVNSNYHEPLTWQQEKEYIEMARDTSGYHLAAIKDILLEIAKTLGLPSLLGRVVRIWKI